MNQNSFPIVALVGPPNSGKSTLLNKIAGKHLAVTSEIAGTTRDRQYFDGSWNGKNFTLADTAGLGLTGEEGLEENVAKQVEIALLQADIIILILDGKQPSRQLGQLLLKKFRNIKKPVILAVNKLDSPKDRQARLAEFASLGIKKIFPVSAISGLGIGDLLDEVAEDLKKSEPASAKPTETGNIAVSIVGKPNVGKSSLLNAILKEERVVVSPLPGTTRTAIDTAINIEGTDYTFIDTAGLKKKEYRQDQPDVFSGFMAFRAIRRSDVCFLTLDPTQGITKQDQRIAAEIINMDKGCIILANKCDLIPSPLARGDVASAVERQRGRTIKKPNDDSYQNIRDFISHHFPFLWMCPAFFVSAITGEGLNEAIAAIKPIFEARNKKIDNQTLTEFLFKKLKTNPPKLLRDQKRPKVFSLHQIDINPPKFELLVNHPATISMQFRKFLENSIIKELEFWGTPIILKLVGKDKA